MTSWRTLAATAAMCVASVSAVHAGPRETDPPKNPKAAEHLEQGKKLFKLEQYEKAIDEYTAGAEIEDAPVFWFSLGQAYRYLHKADKAIHYYELFIKHGDLGPATRQQIERLIDDLRKQIEADKRPPTGAVPGADESRADAQSKPAPTDDTHAKTDGPPPKTSGGTTQPLTPRSDPAQPAAMTDRGDDHPWNLLGWGLTAAGTASVITSGILFVRASNLDDQADHESQTSKRNDLRDQASTRRSLGIGFGIGGGLLLAGGIVDLVFFPRHASHSDVAVRVGITGNGVTVFGRF